MGNVHEIEKYHNVVRIFADRVHAGKLLGEMLQPVYGAEDLVMAIPAGGVPVGMTVARMLGCPFDMVIVRKLKIPGNPEAGFGAMTTQGTLFLNEALLQQLDLRPDQIGREAERVKAELEERDRRLRGGRAFPDIKGKRVIIVDDGLASGYTMLAAVYLIKKSMASEVVVAVPTAPLTTIESIESGVDRIYCVNIREVGHFAVADAYRNWRDLTENEILHMLSVQQKPRSSHRSAAEEYKRTDTSPP
ncbi:MAG: phosphoribosyltransferase family protein [Desulfobacterales bacterium]